MKAKINCKNEKIIITTFIIFFILLINVKPRCQEDSAASESPVSLKDVRLWHSKISTRVGFSSFSNFTFQYERRGKKRLGMSFEFGIFYPINYFGGSGILCSFEGIKLSTAKEGFTLRSGLVIYSKDSQLNNNFSLQLDFRKLQAKDFVLDEGCYAGANSASFEQYDWEGTDLGLMAHINFNSKSEVVNFYIGFGPAYRYQIKSYKIDGTAGSRTPSNKIEKTGTYIMRFDLGMRLRVMR